jgi:hypothetical protein
MRCRVSRWKKTSRGLCRIFVCGGRKVVECVSHGWWKDNPLPRGARASVACGKNCKEETIVVKTSRKQKGYLASDSVRRRGR